MFALKLEKPLWISKGASSTLEGICQKKPAFILDIQTSGECSDLSIPLDGRGGQVSPGAGETILLAEPNVLYSKGDLSPHQLKKTSDDAHLCLSEPPSGQLRESF